jgi:hypothetical protein
MVIPSRKAACHGHLGTTASIANSKHQMWWDYENEDAPIANVRWRFAPAGWRQKNRVPLACQDELGFDVDMLPSLGDGTEPVPSCPRPGAPLAGRPRLLVYRATSAAEVIRLGRRRTSSSPGTPLREP